VFGLDIKSLAIGAVLAIVAWHLLSKRKAIAG
jgi:hypothetical protein